MKRYILCAVLMASGGFSAAAASEAVLTAVDLYGTPRFSSAELDDRFGAAIRKWVDGKNRVGKSKAAAQLVATSRERIERELTTAWKLGWVRLSWMDYYNSGEHVAYVTVDMVEKNDIKTRMPWRAIKGDTLHDPAGLLNLWRTYTETGWSLVRNGDMTLDRAPCPAFYCQWGSQKPELKALEDRFIAMVPERKGELIRVFRDEKSPERRAEAVYLLSYISNAKDVLLLLQDALQDPDLEVRAAAMRVFSDMAIYHKDVVLPIEQLTAALDYPTVEDRNKALAVMVGLADNPLYRAYLLRHAAENLVRLLELKQPANHDLAYAVLMVLSKENFSGTDYDAWRQWAAKAKR